MLKKFLAALALAALALPAAAVTICDGCTYQGPPATNLGLHDSTTFDNSTFTNSTTGTNGAFDNFWVFSLAPEGAATLDAVFLPIQNVSEFSAKLFNVESSACGGTGAACSALTLGSLIAEGTTAPAFVSALDFLTLTAGTYAIEVSGLVSGLVPGQSASYAGNLQVAAIPEPETYALMLAGLAVVTGIARRRQRAENAR
jgi:hypothetical protein